jgi:L-alanine-DL-glutamate epimerase-like enolase superfamily enzyme
LLVQRGVDYLNVSVSAVGGFTMGMKAAAVAQAFNTPIGNSDHFSQHLHAAVPNGWRAEFSVNGWPVSKVIFRGVPEPVNGWVTLTDKPGLGVEINEDAVREFRI